MTELTKQMTKDILMLDVQFEGSRPSSSSVLHHHLSPHVFSSSSSSNLISLHLSRCHIPLPSTLQGLSILSILLLHSVGGTETTAEQISRFVSLCPNLKVLRLCDVKFPNERLVVNAPKLRCLAVEGSLRVLSVAKAPYLTSLSLHLVGFSSKARKFFPLSEFERLEDVTFRGGCFWKVTSGSDSIVVQSTS